MKDRQAALNVKVAECKTKWHKIPASNAQQIFTKVKRMPLFAMLAQVGSHRLRAAHSATNVLLEKHRLPAKIATLGCLEVRRICQRTASNAPPVGLSLSTGKELVCLAFQESMPKRGLYYAQGVRVAFFVALPKTLDCPVSCVLRDGSNKPMNRADATNVAQASTKEARESEFATIVLWIKWQKSPEELHASIVRWVISQTKENLQQLVVIVLPVLLVWGAEFAKRGNIVERRTICQNV